MSDKTLHELTVGSLREHRHNVDLSEAMDDLEALLRKVEQAAFELAAMVEDTKDAESDELKAKLDTAELRGRIAGLRWAVRYDGAPYSGLEAVRLEAELKKLEATG